MDRAVDWAEEQRIVRNVSYGLQGLGLRVEGLGSKLLKGGYMEDYIGEYVRGV